MKKRLWAQKTLWMNTCSKMCRYQSLSDNLILPLASINILSSSRYPLLHPLFPCLLASSLGQRISLALQSIFKKLSVLIALQTVDESFRLCARLCCQFGATSFLRNNRFGSQCLWSVTWRTLLNFCTLITCFQSPPAITFALIKYSKIVVVFVFVVLFAFFWLGLSWRIRPKRIDQNVGISGSCNHSIGPGAA